MSRLPLNSAVFGFTLLTFLMTSPISAPAQNATPKPLDDLGLAQGVTEHDTPQFTMKLAAASQTLAEVQTLDSFRKRVYIAPRGLWLTLDAGTFDSVVINAKTGAVRVALSPATPHVKQARLRVEQPAKLPGIGTYRPSAKFVFERDAYTVSLQNQTTSIDLLH